MNIICQLNKLWENISKAMYVYIARHISIHKHIPIHFPADAHAANISTSTQLMVICIYMHKGIQMCIKTLE